MQRWFVLVCFIMSYVSAADTESSSASRTRVLIRNRSGKSIKTYAYSRHRYTLSGDRAFTFWFPLHEGKVRAKDNYHLIFKWPDDSKNGASTHNKTVPSIDVQVIIKGVFRNREHRLDYVVNKEKNGNNDESLLIENPYKKARKIDTVEKT